MRSINFWSGNRTYARKSYEAELLQMCLEVTTPEYGVTTIEVDVTDFPAAEDEGNVLDRAADVLVTVAGNVKFADKQKIVIQQPIAKGLLGYRLLVTRQSLLKELSKIQVLDELKSLSVGIPCTWADAALFRHNGCRVIEKGGIDELFNRLQDRDFDYVALGVNEIETVCKHYAEHLSELVIEPSLMLYYPFPLVFYVNAKQPELALRIQKGLDTILSNGRHESLFQQHYGHLQQQFSLQNRRLLSLTNPTLPDSLRSFSSTFLGSNTT